MKFFSPLIIFALLLSTLSSTSAMHPENSPVSPGIFLKSSYDRQINNAMPTVIGVAAQKPHNLFLRAVYRKEVSPYTFEKEPVVRFYPGRLHNIEHTNFGYEDQPLYGFAQYPTVSCRKKDGTGFYKDKKSCLKAAGELPPVIFFYKTKNALLEGEQGFRYGFGNRNENYEWPTFIINPHNVPSDPEGDGTNFNLQYPLLESNIPHNSENDWENFDAIDNCARGYYYDKNHLQVPLPKLDNRNLYYQLAFPQTLEERHTGAPQRMVKIKFGRKIFDLFFPQSIVFFDRKSFFTGEDGKPDPTKMLSPEKIIYLPMSKLVYENGKRAKLYENKGPDGLVYGEYFELVPFDMLGNKYVDGILSRQTTVSSSCDG